MSYPGRTKFILVALFSLLLVPAYADTGDPTPTAGSRIKHFFVRGYCHVFPCRSTRTHTQSTASAKVEAPNPSETWKLANPGAKAAETKAAIATSPADTGAAPPAGKETAAASTPVEGREQVLVPAGGVVFLKPGDRLPERKHPEYEDWSTPYLPTKMKGDIVLLGKVEKKGFTRELVHVQWREMDPIDLWVIRPTGIKKPPVIVYIYGFPTNGERYKDDNFCEMLTGEGFAAIGFVPALNGQRIHDRPGREWFVGQLQESIGASVHDVQMILTYLAGRGDVDMNRVGVWGVGSGASIAIIAAAVDPRIKALDLLNPWGDWPDWLAQSSIIPEKERPRLLVPSFLESVKDLDPVKWLPELKDRQVRLQYILDGITVTPPEAREHMEAATPPNVEIVHYQDTEEFGAKVDSSGKRFDWIRQKLGTESELREANIPASQETTQK
jgi:hypothetical protein